MNGKAALTALDDVTPATPYEGAHRAVTEAMLQYAMVPYFLCLFLQGTCRCHSRCHHHMARYFLPQRHEGARGYATDFFFSFLTVHLVIIGPSHKLVELQGGSIATCPIESQRDDHGERDGGCDAMAADGDREEGVSYKETTPPKRPGWQ